jgi:hypothetical protein
MGLKAVFFKQFFQVFLPRRKGGYRGISGRAQLYTFHLKFPG